MKYFDKVFYVLVIIFVLTAVMIYLYFPGIVPVFGHGGGRTAYIVDPGHGGADGGAVGADGTIEKDVNLQISVKLTDLLVLYGHSAAMTRDSDDIGYPELAKTIRQKKVYDTKARVEFAHGFKNPVFVKSSETTSRRSLSSSVLPVKFVLFNQAAAVDVFQTFG